MNNKKAIILTISILLLGLIVAGSTFAWYTWRSSDAERTSITFSVPDGNDELKAILDADNTSYTGLVPASGCGSNNALMATITLHYKNMTISNAKTFTVSSSGSGYAFPLNYDYGIRPAVSLDSTLKFTGTGAYNNPYIPTT